MKQERAFINKLRLLDQGSGIYLFVRNVANTLSMTYQQ